LSIIADRQGPVLFRCTVISGNLHTYMIGDLQIGQNALQRRAADQAVLDPVACLKTFLIEHDSPQPNVSILKQAIWRIFKSHKLGYKTQVMASKSRHKEKTSNET